MGDGRGTAPEQSGTEALRQALRRAKEEGKRLKATLEKHRVTDREVADASQRAQLAFVQAIDVDLRYAVKHDLELAMWQTVLYPTITAYRRLLSTPAKPNKTHKGHKGQKKGRTDPQESFAAYVTTALEFYQARLRHYQHSYNLQLSTAEFLRLHAINSTWGAEGFSSLSDQHLAVLCCHRCYTYMGDLARYRETCKSNDQWGNPPQRNWHQMDTYYNRALKVLPINGNPYNQFGILSFDLKKFLDALYFNCRALAVQQPFANATKNLDRLFHTASTAFHDAFPTINDLIEARETLTKNAKRPKGHEKLTLEQQNAAKTLAANHFVGCYLHLLALLRKGDVDEDEFLHLSKFVCLQLKTLVAFAGINEGMLMHVVLCNIFAVHTAQGTDESDANRTARYRRVDTKQRAVRLALRFALEFISVCLSTKRKFRRRVPVGVLFVSWLVPHVRCLETFCADKAEAQARVQFVKALCDFANQLLGDEARTAPSGKAVVDGDRPRTTCVPEDIDTLGFLPLAHLHSALTPAMCTTVRDLSKDRRGRLVRLKQACDALCLMFRGRRPTIQRTSPNDPAVLLPLPSDKEESIGVEREGDDVGERARAKMLLYFVPAERAFSVRDPLAPPRPRKRRDASRPVAFQGRGRGRGQGRGRQGRSRVRQGPRSPRPRHSHEDDNDHNRDDEEYDEYEDEDEDDDDQEEEDVGSGLSDEGYDNSAGDGAWSHGENRQEEGHGEEQEGEEGEEVQGQEDEDYDDYDYDYDDSDDSQSDSESASDSASDEESDGVVVGIGRHAYEIPSRPPAVPQARPGPAQRGHTPSTPQQVVLAHPVRPAENAHHQHQHHQHQNHRHHHQHHHQQRQHNRPGPAAIGSASREEGAPMDWFAPQAQSGVGAGLLPSANFSRAVGSDVRGPNASPLHPFAQGATSGPGAGGMAQHTAGDVAARLGEMAVSSPPGFAPHQQPAHYPVPPPHRGLQPAGAVHVAPEGSMFGWLQPQQQPQQQPHGRFQHQNQHRFHHHHQPPA